MLQSVLLLYVLIAYSAVFETVFYITIATPIAVAVYHPLAALWRPHVVLFAIWAAHCFLPERVISHLRHHFLFIFFTIFLHKLPSNVVVFIAKDKKWSQFKTFHNL